MKKLTIISFIFLAVAVVIFFQYNSLFADKYSIKELQHNYPSIIDLKKAVQSGELKYDRLPEKAQRALDDFNMQPDTILNFTYGLK